MNEKMVSANESEISLIGVEFLINVLLHEHVDDRINHCFNETECLVDVLFPLPHGSDSDHYSFWELCSVM